MSAWLIPGALHGEGFGRSFVRLCRPNEVGGHQAAEQQQDQRAEDPGVAGRHQTGRRRMRNLQHVADGIPESEDADGGGDREPQVVGRPRHERLSVELAPRNAAEIERHDAENQQAERYAAGRFAKKGRHAFHPVVVCSEELLLKLYYKNVHLVKFW